MEAIVAFAVTVTLSPERMMTSSVTAGTVRQAMEHSVSRFQLPLPGCPLLSPQELFDAARSVREEASGRKRQLEFGDTNAPWPGGTVPAVTDDVIIRSGDNVTVNGQTPRSPP